MAGTNILYGIRVLRVAALDADGGIPAVPSWTSSTVPQQANLAAVQINGQQTELRGGDQLIAVIQDEDEIIGFDITFQNAKLDPSLFAAIHGGTWADPTYTPPKLGTVRPKFYAEIYTAEYKEGAQHQEDQQGYIRFSFWNCRANLPTFNLADRTFTVPQFTIKARENVTDSLPAWGFTKVSALP